MISKGETVTDQNIEYVFSLVADGEEEQISNLTDSDCVCVTSKGKPVKAKTLGQKKYLEAIKNNTITIGVGPAGTGKTYLAVAMAVKAFRAKQVNRIILTRPAVEAGEKLGFLPGDLQSKVDPYLRPLYDALFDMLGAENFQKCQERGDIEVAPLAYMRGRTLDNAFIRQVGCGIEPIAINQQELGCHLQIGNSNIHPLERGTQDIYLVDTLGRHLGHSPRHSLALDNLAQEITLTLGHLL